MRGDRLDYRPIRSSFAKAPAPGSTGPSAMADPVIVAPGTGSPGDVFERLLQIAWARAQAQAYEEAEALYRQLRALGPGRFEPLAGLGALHYLRGRAAEALDHYDAARTLRGSDPGLLVNRGLALLSLGRGEEALASYDEAIARAPGFAEAHLGRGDARVKLGQPAAALDDYHRAIALKPDLALAHNNRAAALLELGRAAEAVTGYQIALALKPDLADAWNGHGASLLRLKRPAEALASLDQALALRPDYAEAHCNRGAALRDLKRPEEAIAAHDTALTFNPRYAEALNNKAVALSDLLRADEALAAYDAALVLAPDAAAVHDNRSVLLAELGRFEDAWRSAQRAVALAPDNARYHYNLTMARPVFTDAAHLAAMQTLANQDALPLEARIDLHYALGKAYDDLDQAEAAFAHWRAGAALKRAQVVYDEAAHDLFLSETTTVFDPAFFADRQGRGADLDGPILIFGMPRSGTTLIEQILASHPRVFGAGEADAFVQALTTLGGAPADAATNPAAATYMSNAQWRDLGERYVARLQALAGGAPMITDKTLANFHHLGLIHAALPGARFIHVSRDPLDTGLSCFSKAFAGEHPYSYDLGELGRYYRRYEGLMAHWRSVLPEGAILEIRYEAVVADLEGQTRRILAHCGLDWRAECLDFHRTARLVRTASATQVRQPIHDRAIGRWRRYAPYLQPLIRALGLETDADSLPIEPGRSRP